MTKYEEMKESAASASRNFQERQRRCWQYGMKLVNGFGAYCGIPDDQMRLLRWNGDASVTPYEEAEEGMKYTISGAMQFNEDDQYWHFGLRIVLTGSRWVFFGLGVADREGKVMVKIGPGKARQIDISDQSQCNEFYESIVETIKGSYREGKPKSTIGFSFAPQTDALKGTADKEPLKIAS